MATPKTIVTPKGTARWPKVNKPDTKFDENGVFTCDLILDAAEAEPLIKSLTEIRDAGYKDFLVSEKKQKLKLAPLPWKPEEDEAGNETGRMVLKFKLKAKGKGRDGTMYDRKVALFDSKGKPTTAEVWGGSGIKVAFEPRAWYVAAHGVGIGLQLKAVQVIELVTKGDRSAEGYGFGKEDGFEAEIADPAKTPDAPPIAADGVDGGDF